MKIIQQSFSNESNRYLWTESSQVLQFLCICQCMRVPHDNLYHRTVGSTNGPTHRVSHQNTLKSGKWQQGMNRYLWLTFQNSNERF